MIIARFAINQTAPPAFLLPFYRSFLGSVDICCGAGSRVVCSTCYRYQRDACCNLHGDVGVPQQVYRSVRQPSPIANFMHPEGYDTHNP